MEVFVIQFFRLFYNNFQILPEEKAMQKLFERILQTIKKKLEDGFELNKDKIFIT